MFPSVRFPGFHPIQVMEAGPADDRFVFAFSDANFERYGITGQAGHRGDGTGDG